jgi:hypothetical protein
VISTVLGPVVQSFGAKFSLSFSAFQLNLNGGGQSAAVFCGKSYHSDGIQALFPRFGPRHCHVKVDVDVLLD